MLPAAEGATTAVSRSPARRRKPADEPKRGSRAHAAEDEDEQQAPGARHLVRGAKQGIAPPVGGFQDEAENRGDEPREHSYQRGPGRDPPPPLLAAIEVPDLSTDVARLQG